MASATSCYHMPHKGFPCGFQHLGAAVSISELCTIISIGLILAVCQGQVCQMMDCSYLCVYNLFLVWKTKTYLFHGKFMQTKKNRAVFMCVCGRRK